MAKTMRKNNLKIQMLAENPENSWFSASSQISSTLLIPILLRVWVGKKILQSSDNFCPLKELFKSFLTKCSLMTQVYFFYADSRLEIISKFWLVRLKLIYESKLQSRPYGSLNSGLPLRHLQNMATNQISHGITRPKQYRIRKWQQSWRYLCPTQI